MSFQADYPAPADAWRRIEARLRMALAGLSVAAAGTGWLVWVAAAELPERGLASARRAPATGIRRVELLLPPAEAATQTETDPAPHAVVEAPLPQAESEPLPPPQAPAAVDDAAAPALIHVEFVEAPFSPMALPDEPVASTEPADAPAEAEPAPAETTDEASASAAETSLEPAAPASDFDQPDADAASAAPVEAVPPASDEAVASPSVTPGDEEVVTSPVALEDPAPAPALAEQKSVDESASALQEEPAAPERSAEAESPSPDASSAPVDPRLVENAPATSEPPASAAAAPVAQQPSVAVAAPKISAAQVESLVHRGHRLLETGDIAAARLLYERAASAGDPEALTALGRTFDPQALKAWGVVGLAPDEERARYWYRKAEEARRAAR